MQHEPIRARVALEKGVEVEVTPLTRFARSALKAAATNMYPEPDRAPYEKPIETAIKSLTSEPMMSKAEHDPEWLKAYRHVLTLRSQCYVGLLLDSAVDHAERDAITATYARQVEATTKALKGTPAGAANVSGWVTTLLTVLANDSEIQALTNLAQGATPLTDGQFVNGLRFFRPMAVYGADSRGIPASAESSGLPVSAVGEQRPE